MSYAIVNFEQWLQEILDQDPADYELDPDFVFDGLFLHNACEMCGCTEQEACAGGCSWSERFLIEKRWICSRCAPEMIIFQINMAALNLWRRNLLIGGPGNGFS
jgi:hypothetical protein